MTDSFTAVYGICSSTAHADSTVESLKNGGFTNSDISVLYPSSDTSKQFAHEKHSKAPEGAATGAGTGAAIGGTLGLLAGIGAIAIPGVGPFIAAGPIMGLLAGVGVGGAVGTMTGALIGLGIPEYEAKRFEKRIKKGGVLLSVHCANSDSVKRSKEILEKCGVEDVGSKTEAKVKQSEESVAHTY